MPRVSLPGDVPVPLSQWSVRYYQWWTLRGVEHGQSNSPLLEHEGWNYLYDQMFYGPFHQNQLLIDVAYRCYQYGYRNAMREPMIVRQRASIMINDAADIAQTLWTAPEAQRYGEGAWPE